MKFKRVCTQIILRVCTNKYAWQIIIHSVANFHVRNSLKLFLFLSKIMNRNLLICCIISSVLLPTGLLSLKSCTWSITGLTIELSTTTRSRTTVLPALAYKVQMAVLYKMFLLVRIEIDRKRVGGASSWRLCETTELIMKLFQDQSRITMFI